MKEAPVDGLGVAAGAQGSCDRAASVRQQGSGSQRHQFPPRWGGKEWPKDRQNFSNGIGKGHEHPPERDIALISFYLTSKGVHAWFFLPNCTKSRSVVDRLVGQRPEVDVRWTRRSQEALGHQEGDHVLSGV